MFLFLLMLNCMKAATDNEENNPGMANDRGTIMLPHSKYGYRL